MKAEGLLARALWETFEGSARLHLRTCACMGLYHVPTPNYVMATQQLST